MKPGFTYHVRFEIEVHTSEPIKELELTDCEMALGETVLDERFANLLAEYFPHRVEVEVGKRLVSVQPEKLRLVKGAKDAGKVHSVRAGKVTSPEAAG